MTSLGFYNTNGPVVPGTISLWDEYQNWKQTPKGQAQQNAGLIGSPDTIRRRLAKFAESNVDQVILLNQAGRNTHTDIMASLQLFADEVMPEFHALEPAHTEWKQSVLSGERSLDAIDTSPFQMRSNQTPTKKLTA